MSDETYFSNVTLRDLTARCRFSLATVSRALRDDPRISEATKKEIQALAKEMGYRPNPMIKSLMLAHKRGSPRNELVSNVAWLNTHPEKDFWHSTPYGRHLIDAAKERANELGYGFEELWSLEPGMTAKRLHQIAHTRYVRGLLIPGTVNTLMEEGFPWEQYTVVCIRERQLGQVDWHRTNAASRQNIQTAFNQLRDLGYRRIAFAGGIYIRDEQAQAQMLQFNAGKVSSREFLLQEGIWAQLSGFLCSQAFIPKRERIHPFLFNSEPGVALTPLAEWLKKVRPEAVISNGRTIMEAAEAAGLRVPEDLAIAHTHLDDDVQGWAGINPHLIRQARSAVDMLCAQIERNERGVPEFPKLMHIKGEWCDGWTAPAN
jgi:LacI family transcriptional regulator